MSTCSWSNNMLHTSVLFGLSLDPEDRGDVPPKRRLTSNGRCENLKSCLTSVTTHGSLATVWLPLISTCCPMFWMCLCTCAWELVHVAENNGINRETEKRRQPDRKANTREQYTRQFRKRKRAHSGKARPNAACFFPVQYAELIGGTDTRHTKGRAVLDAN
jgi:hypothetical protein